MNSKRNQLLVTVFMGLCVLSGATYNIMQKLQNMSMGEKKNFDHPYFQTFLAAIGETCAFLFYFLKKRCERPEPSTLLSEDTFSHDEPPPFKKKLLAIPAALDMFENVLTNIAMTMIAASIVQMMRSSIFVYCALLGLFYLKK